MFCKRQLYTRTGDISQVAGAVRYSVGPQGVTVQWSGIGRENLASGTAVDSTGRVLIARLIPPAQWPLATPSVDVASSGDSRNGVAGREPDVPTIRDRHSRVLRGTDTTGYLQAGRLFFESD